MAITRLNPYINLNGTVEDAVREQAVDAKVEALRHFGDMTGVPISENDKARVVHAQLRIGDTALSFSDAMTDHPVTVGTHAHVCLTFDNAEDLQRRFDALAVGGTVTQPVQDAFWGATFGTLIDRFGIQWMFTCPVRQQ